MRPLLTALLALALPTALWLLWLALSGRQAQRIEMPVVRLILAGAALAVAVALFAVASRDTPPGATYHPPRLDEQGRIVPGYFD